jgi:ferrochelatase
LPLYPQFSHATTLSSINEWKRQTKKQKCVIPTKLICCYPNQPSFIEAIVENINIALNRFHNVESTNIDLIFSAHGVPLSNIKKGDPYQLQVEETIKSILELGKWSSPHSICYQSKVGLMKWLSPSLIETIKFLGDKGRKNLLVIPVAFVTDHIETLHEINFDARNLALSHGVQQFEMVPALNNNPKFIQCLAELVHSCLVSDKQSSTCQSIWNNYKGRAIPALCPNFDFQSEKK